MPYFLKHLFQYFVQKFIWCDCSQDRLGIIAFRLSNLRKRNGGVVKRLGALRWGGRVTRYGGNCWRCGASRWIRWVSVIDSFGQIASVRKHSLVVTCVSQHEQ